MAYNSSLRPLREKRDLRDYDPSIIRIEFKKMLCSNKSEERSKQLELWKVITLAAYYEKLMNITRPRSIRQAIIYMKEFDAVANRIDSTIETLDQITNEVNNEISCYATNLKKAWVTKIDSFENGFYQLSVQLQKQQKAVNDVANHFSENMELINVLRDNFKEHENLFKKCQKFDADILAFSKLVRLQRSDKIITPVKERWSVEDLKALPFIVDGLNKVINNLDGLRTVCKLIAPTNLPEEKDITKLIRQAQKLCGILEVNKTITNSPIPIMS